MEEKHEMTEKAKKEDIKFEVKYKETKEVLTKICRLYIADSASINCRLFVGILIPFVVLLMFIYGNPGGGTPSGIAMFVVKAVLVWIVAFFVMKYISKFIGSKYADIVALGDGETKFNERTKRRKGEVLAVRVCFKEDDFQNITKTLTKTYRYVNVTRLIETKDAMAVVVRNPETGEKGLYGFPKDAFTVGDADVLRTFLTEKCKGAKNGFIKYK